MAVLIADYEEKRLTETDRRTARQIRTEQQKNEERLVMAGFVLLLMMIVSAIAGAYGMYNVMRTDAIIQQNTEAK